MIYLTESYISILDEKVSNKYWQSYKDQMVTIAGHEVEPQARAFFEQRSVLLDYFPP